MSDNAEEAAGPEALSPECEDRYRALVEAVAAIVWITDAAGAFAERQLSWERATGQTWDEHRGWGWLDAIHPDDRDRIAATWREALASGGRCDAECRIWNEATRDYRHYEARAVPVRAPDGTVREWIGTCTDVTGRIRAEQRLEAVLASIGDHLVCYDHEWRYTYVNEQATELLGKRREELLGRSIWDVFPEAVGNEYHRELHRAVAEQRPVRFEHYYAPFDRWYENHIYPSADGVTVFSADITWRKTAEREWRWSEARYRALVEASSQIVWTWNAETGDGDSETVQRWWEELTGQSAEEQATVGWLDAVHVDDRTRVAAAWTWAMGTASPFDVEYRVRCRDGSHRHISSRAVPVSHEDGPAGEWIGMMSDITESKRHEEELRDADRRKDEFLATLAHELRNPLAPIRHGLHILKIADPDSEAAKRARAVMDRQISQMVRLIDDLLDVSRITRGKLELRTERIYLADVVREAVETIRPIVEANAHELEISLPPEPVVLEADQTRLSQVFANLLNNSAKYTPRGGRIRMVAERRHGEVAVTVTDTGAGITPALLPRIFDMFVQGDTSLEKRHGGLGIGLTLVKRLVEMHGGRVEARSEGPGLGSELVVRLPEAPAHAGAPVAPEPDVAATGGAARCRVLVADDNEDSIESLGLLLEYLGGEVRTAADGVEALEVAATFRPDLILLDIGMPRLNGYETARRIRELVWGREVLLAALTGWGQDEDKQRSREAGFDAHIVKPVDPATLERLLADAAARRA